MTSVPSFWVKLRKHQKLPGASVSLKLHKFSLIFGLLLEVSGREVKGDLQPCDRWFGWQWEQQGRERENHKVISSSKGTGSKALEKLMWLLNGKEPACNAGDPGILPGSGRSLGWGHGNPLQYSCLEKPMDKGDWQATFHRVTKSWTRLKWLSTHP